MPRKKKSRIVFNEETFWARVTYVLGYLKREWGCNVAPAEKTQYTHPGSIDAKPAPNTDQKVYKITEWAADLQIAYDLKNVEDAEAALRPLFRHLKL